MESLIFALYLLVKVVLVSLGSYGLARIFLTESIFEEARDWLIDRCYFKIDPEDAFTFQKHVDSPVIVRWDPEEEVETVVSKYGYRTDLPKGTNFLVGKFGDLIDCLGCGSNQFALWLGIFGIALTLLPLQIIAVTSSFGLIFLLLEVIG